MNTKKLIFLLFLSLNFLNAQTKNTKTITKKDSNIKIWSKTFSNFNIKDFKEIEITNFKDLTIETKSINSLANEYKIIGTYSPNKSKFVDIYSYLNLEKKGDYYTKNVEVDQNIDLYLTETNQKIRVFQSGSREGIDEVFWLSETSIMLLGYSFVEEKKPILILIDLDSKNVVRLENQNKLCKLLKNYKSNKLQKLKII